MSVHATAHVDPRARLAPGAEIGPGAVIAADVELGPECRIGPYAVLLDGARLGARCRVHAHAVIADTPQDLKFSGVASRVEIGDDVVLREGVTVHRGTLENSATRIGNGCYLMANSHVAHNAQLGARVILVNGALVAGHVEIGDGAFMSGNSGAHQFVRIGRLAMIAGGAVVTKDVLPFCTTVNSAHNRIAGLNIVGLRRAGLSAAERLDLRRAFRLVCRSGLNVRQALDRLRAEFPSGPAAEWAPFIAASKRGICTRGGKTDAGAETE